LGENPHSREHIIKIMLAAELQVGLSKIMAKYEISKSAAVLLMITGKLYEEGAISQEVMDLFSQRYRRRLVEIAKEGRENSHLSKLEIEKQKRSQCQASAQQAISKEKLEGVAAAFRGIYENWDREPYKSDLNWKIKNLAYAKKHPEFEFARLIIAKDCDTISPKERDKQGESAI